jgi:hypothetical protein
LFLREGAGAKANRLFSGPFENIPSEALKSLRSGVFFLLVRPPFTVPPLAQVRLKIGPFLCLIFPIRRTWNRRFFFELSLRSGTFSQVIERILTRSKVSFFSRAKRGIQFVYTHGWSAFPKLAQRWSGDALNKTAPKKARKESRKGDR